jgi:ParB family chromosome partitioning protein
VQISSGYGSREGAPIGRNRYVELDLKRAKLGQAAKANPAQKPCEKMTEAIVMDGGKRGKIVKVCADPSCRTHYGNRLSPQAMERERAEERKRIEKQKLAITIRHRILAATLERVSAPLKKADLLAVAQYVIAHLPYNQTPQLAKRHKVEVEKDGSPEEQLMKRISTYDESALGRLLLEVSLLDSAYQRLVTQRRRCAGECRQAVSRGH